MPDIRTEALERLVRRCIDRDGLHTEGLRPDDLPVVILWGSDSTRPQLLQELQQISDWPGARAFLVCDRLRWLRPYEIAYRIAFRLGQRTVGFGRMRFPRFFLGLTVIGQDLKPSVRHDAAARRENINRMFRNRFRLQHQVRSSIKVLAKSLGLSALANSGALDLLLDLLFGVVGRASRLQRSARWYRTALGHLVDDPVDALVELKRDELEKNYQKVDEVLCRAFVDDLRDAFRKPARWWFSRRLDAVALLDNAESEAVRGFLKILVDQGNGSGPLLVVAASDWRYPAEAEREPAKWQPDSLDRASIKRWSEINEGRDDGRFYPVDVTPIVDVSPTSGANRSQVHAIAQHWEIGERFLPIVAFAHRLTAGHPTGMEMVIDILRRTSALPGAPDGVVTSLDRRTILGCDYRPGNALDEEIFTLVHRGRPVEPDAHKRWPDALRQPLVLMALAENLSDDNLDPIRRAHPQCRDYITGFRDRDLWVTIRKGEPPRLHPFARRAIAHRVVREVPITGVDPNLTWEAAHTLLRGAADARGDVAAVLYHDLALGHVHQVAMQLSKEFAVRSREDWYELLIRVTSAPLKLPDRAESAEAHLNQLCAHKEPEPQVSRRLVAALQLHTDPLGDPHHNTCATIASELDALGGGRTFLNTQANVFRACRKELAPGPHQTVAESKRPGRLARFWRDITRPARAAVMLMLMGPVAAAAYFVVIPVLHPNPCPGDLMYQEDQCVGFTDNNDVFDPSLADVLGKIRAENQRIGLLGKPVVSLGVMVSMPKAGSNLGLAISTREQVEGLYLAQRAANNSGQFGDVPLLSLFVANSGEDTGQWRQLVPSLIERSQRPGDGRLVAVIASGNSFQSMLDAIGALSHSEIPVIPIRLTASQLSVADTGDSNMPLARATPTNPDQVAAAVAAVKATTHRAVLVADTDPADYYSTSLAAEFEKRYPDADHVIAKVERYDKSLGGVSTAMRAIVTKICQTRPDLIYFAGRSAELEDFVRVLPSRTCQDYKIRLTTASDAVIFAGDVPLDSSGVLLQGLKANTEITFTALTHPDAWSKRPDAFSQGVLGPLRSDCDDCFMHVFPHSSLADGSVIMGYDSLLIAVDAIRPRTGVDDPSRGFNDSPKLVAQQLKQLNGVLSVAGASGWISLSSDSGDPVNKAIAMLRIQTDGQLAFDRLTAPNGTPCEPSLDPPNC